MHRPTEIPVRFPISNLQKHVKSMTATFVQSQTIYMTPSMLLFILNHNPKKYTFFFHMLYANKCEWLGFDIYKIIIITY